MRRKVRTHRLCLPEMLERRTLLSAMPAGDEFRINTYTTSNQINSAAAMDALGNFVVVWQSSGQDDSSDGIYGQRYNALGVPQGQEFQVHMFTTGSQSFPAVAMDSDGDFVVTWQSAGQGGSFAEIWARRFSASGAPAGDEFHVNTITENGQLAPAVAVDDAGNFVVAWHSFDATTGYEIYARRYDAAGTALTTEEFLVNTHTTGSQSSAAVAVDSDGDFVVVWQSFLQDGASNGVFAQRFDSAGMKAGDEFQVNQFTTGGQRNADVAMDNAGNFVITWESAGQDGAGYGVYARRYDAAGSPSADEFRVNTVTADAQVRPDIAMDNDGDFVITWASRLQDGSLYGIYAQCYTAAGVPEGDEFRVNTTTANLQFLPAVAADADGDFVVVWQSDLQDGSSFGVYGQRYTVGGGGEAPQVTMVDFVWENGPQRLVYTFSADVSASLQNTDIMLENLTDVMTVSPAEIAVMYDVPTNTATFTFTQAPTPSRTWLRDGRYKATLIAAGITTAGGTPMAADHVYEDPSFFFLQADHNHDAVVNLADFNRLAGNFGQSPRDFTFGDFNYDTVVNLADFNILAGQFGKALPAQPLQTSSSTFGEMKIGKAAKDKRNEDRLAELV